MQSCDGNEALGTPPPSSLLGHTRFIVLKTPISIFSCYYCHYHPSLYSMTLAAVIVAVEVVTQSHTHPCTGATTAKFATCTPGPY